MRFTIRVVGIALFSVVSVGALLRQVTYETTFRNLTQGSSIASPVIVRDTHTSLF